MHTLNKVETEFMEAVAKRVNVNQVWQPPYKKICVFCLQELQQSNNHLSSLITKKELKSIENNINKFHADRLRWIL
ncbi:hypothetical protein COJ07_24090 [Bacillus cereus]|uniref:Uncharacterized protein n=2 Tax=Bacillus cereus TaxID=1396 RepID=A0A2B0TG47_BACCE|nr:hypothetical protein COJ07_24090 [Bacillus cereus]PFU43830.1 hypothetical protein COK86_10320 [Bacillus cereus]